MRTIRRISLGGSAALEAITHFPHRAPMVWEAAIEPGGLSRWFPGQVDYEPTEGGKITFSGDPNVDDHEGVVTEYEPGRRIAFSWGRNEVHLIMTPVDGTTDFVLIDRLAHPNEAARNAAGWHERLTALERLLDVPTPEQPWHELYVHYVNSGFPSGAPVPASALLDDEGQLGGAGDGGAR